MKVRLLCGRVDARSFQPAGSIVDLPAAEARGLIAAKSAEPVGSGDMETATIGAPETAVRKRGRPRKVTQELV